MAILGFAALLSVFVTESVTILAFHVFVHSTITFLIRSSKNALHASQEPHSGNSTVRQLPLAPSVSFFQCHGGTCLLYESVLPQSSGPDRAVCARYSFSASRKSQPAQWGLYPPAP